MTEQEFSQLKNAKVAANSCHRPDHIADVGKMVAPELIAKGEKPATKMNKTESAYSTLLEARKRAGEIAWYCFEGITLKLAHDTRYTPDFVVMLASGELEMHETKGFMRDDARVKLHIAASTFPFRFWLVRREKGEWNISRVKV